MYLFRPVSPLKAARALPRLAWSHALALALVATFSFISYLVLSFATQSSTDTGLILTAAQQRLNGQQVALLAAQIDRADEPADIARLQAQLVRALYQFEQLHQLVYTDQQTSGSLSETTRALYERPPYQLERHVAAYIEHAQALITTSFLDVPEADETIDALIAASIPVDVGLGRVVTQLRDERRDRVQALLNLQLGMLISTLISLAVIGVGILVPMQRRVRSAVELLAREIETRAEAEAALAESAARYQSLVSALTEGVLLYDRNGNLVTYNSSAERLLGLSLAQYVGKPTYDPAIRVIYPDGREQQPSERPIMHTLTTGEPVHDAVFGFIHGDEPPVWFKVNVQPVMRAGQVDGAAVSLTDITESKRVSEELERSRALMQMILDNSPDAIFVVDRQSRILLVNPAEARMMGLTSPAEAVGKTVFD
ncbi:MAG: PAS domain-containing protein, partial [Anaerolinea sp.]|nr:PAS domain-containing protein [Anaerolinea sp.]